MPATLNIISRLNSRFSNITTDKEQPDFLTRDIGGQWRNNQPYVSGYFQVMFGLPKTLFPQQTEAASQWLHSTCEGFTPHTQTLNVVDIVGQGQIGSSFVTSVTTTREFTLTFREYQYQPVLNVIRQWASVFDPFTGVSPLTGAEFIPSNYKGWCAIMQTKPVRSKDSDFELGDIEEVYVYQGVQCTNIPIDTAAASDITANDTVQLSATFRFDGAPLTSAEEGVSENVRSLFNSYRYWGSEEATFDQYVKNAELIKPWEWPGESVTPGATPTVTSGG